MTPTWFLLVSLALMAIGGLMLFAGYRSVESRAEALERGFESLREAQQATEQETRRAHVRIENDQRQITALGKQLGWVDNKSHTRVFTHHLDPALPQPLPASDED